jgi:hypothetical protein
MLPQKNSFVISHTSSYNTRVKVTTDGCWCGEKIIKGGAKRCCFCESLHELETILSTGINQGSYANITPL